MELPIGANDNIADFLHADDVIEVSEIDRGTFVNVFQCMVFIIYVQLWLIAPLTLMFSGMLETVVFSNQYRQTFCSSNIDGTSAIAV